MYKIKIKTIIIEIVFPFLYIILLISLITRVISEKFAQIYFKFRVYIFMQHVYFYEVEKLGHTVFEILVFLVHPFSTAEKQDNYIQHILNCDQILWNFQNFKKSV